MLRFFLKIFNKVLTKYIEYDKIIIVSNVIYFVTS